MFELIVTRGGLGPAIFAGEARRDRIEVVSLHDGEVALFWDLTARDAARRVRELRSDLATLDAEDFLVKWGY